MRATRPDALAERIGEAGLATAVLLCPFVLGGAHPGGRFVYLLGAALAALGMASAATLRGRTLSTPRWIGVVLLSATAIPVLQVIPLPLSPAAVTAVDFQEMLPAWEGTLGLAEWRTLSVSPRDTLLGLAVMVGHALLVFALIERLRSVDDLRRAITAIAVSTIGMVLLALAQYGARRGGLCGLIDHPYTDFRDLQGTFTNKNHFAHFALLGLGPTVWLVFARLRHADSGRCRKVAGRAVLGRVGWLVCPAMVVTAILASRSRGAGAALAISTLIVAIVLTRAGRFTLRQAIAIAAVLALTLAGVSIMGTEAVSSRMGALVQLDIDALDQKHARRAIWQANIEAFCASPIFGFGVGSHRHIYPAFIEAPFAAEFTHAESGYLQIASETGLLGLLVLALAIAGVGSAVIGGLARCNDQDELGLRLAILFGLIASATHSVVDFVWYRPGLVAPTLVLLIGAVRLDSLREAAAVREFLGVRRKALLHAGGLAALSSFALILTWPSVASSRAWADYLRASSGERAMIQRLVTEDPQHADPILADTIGQASHRITNLLRRTIELDPKNSKAHRLYAYRLINRFELESDTRSTGMTLDVIADAARNGGFATVDERGAWLDRALGPHATDLREARRHARIALRLCPFDAEAWLCLASLSFLDPSLDDPRPLIEQACRLCPHDGGVLFESGRLFALHGDIRRQFDLWQRCLNVRGGHVTRLVLWVSQTTPASAFIGALQPDFEALEIALQQYSRRGNQDDMVALAKYAYGEAERAEKGGKEPPARLAYRWRHAGRALRSIGRYEEATEAAEKAVALAPHVFSSRHELAVCLRELGRHDEADAHTRWCLARRPDLAHLREWLTDSARRRVVADRGRGGSRPLYGSSEQSGRDPNAPAQVVPCRTSSHQGMIK